jgi:curved DNA-binding protein CbpA
MDPFECLGLPPRLSLDAAELEKRVQEESARSHPDAGGEPARFEEVRQAGEILKNPASRLRAAIARGEGEPPSRGAVPGSVMDYFSPVATLLENVSTLIKKRREARSGLGRAVLDARVPEVKRELEEMAGHLSTLEAELVGRFPEFDERGWERCSEEMAEVSRGLVFLRKWQAELREAHGKIFEALLGG